MHTDRAQLFDYRLDEYRDLMKRWGEPAFRAEQLARWVWQRQVTCYEKMTNLPEALRARLGQELPFARATIAKRQVSGDGTRKYLLQFADGVKVECVGIPQFPESEQGHLTVCVSTQAGCALGCLFCTTGQNGFIRNLSGGEIAEQIVHVSSDFKRRAGSVVVMGQGEPLLNYDATLAGLRIINATTGLNIGARHITLSTAGIIAGIRRLADETEQFTLAVSLHAAQQELRDQLMPGLRGQKLSDLRMALIEYRNKGGRRVSLEYALIAGGNDRAGDLKALVEFTRGLKAHINLISLNLPKTGKTGKMHSDTPVGEHGLSAASEERMRQVAAELRKAGLEVSIRTKRGADINAACGQLAQR